MLAVPPRVDFSSPLVAAVLIVPSGDESAGSGRMEVICALVYFSHMRT